MLAHIILFTEELKYVAKKLVILRSWHLSVFCLFNLITFKNKQFETIHLMFYSIHYQNQIREKEVKRGAKKYSNVFNSYFDVNSVQEFFHQLPGGDVDYNIPFNDVMSLKGEGIVGNRWDINVVKYLTLQICLLNTAKSISELRLSPAIFREFVQRYLIPQLQIFLF